MSEEKQLKLQFKNQKFQADAAQAVCTVFSGQPNYLQSYVIDRGHAGNGANDFTDMDYTGFRNAPIAPDLYFKDADGKSQILKNIQNIQRIHRLPVSSKLEGRYNLTIEMETGVGKTYTYIKTMYELQKQYGWSKFIIVVPSIAIREGIYKSFQTTEDHFKQMYGTAIRYFIYNSSKLERIEQFASDNAINAMIINSQAFNARGADARRIYMDLDSFRSRKPIDVIAKTNPILIIDEPQSVEGEKTVEMLKKFNALFTLRYSATPRKQFNLIYRLDAVEAYNMKLVKKISVKGIEFVGSSATDGYVYVSSLSLSPNAPPKANVWFDAKQANGVKRRLRTLEIGSNLYSLSGELEEYKNRYIISEIDPFKNRLVFLNGQSVSVGQVIGSQNEDALRQIQIRETIKTHLEKERELFRKGIKVLSLFFIDEVAKYRQYDDGGDELNGQYATWFEDIYQDEVAQFQPSLKDAGYVEYLGKVSQKKIHAGYFSIDKKKHFIDSDVKRGKDTSDDIDAFDLIMRNKEELLSLSNSVRFIFSHSALKEGWDNPNVFQICTLKQSSSETRKRQEVGRGLRLCVNKDGIRMDNSVLGANVHVYNILTVIANESYKSFSESLQKEIADIAADRPKTVNISLFTDQTVITEGGEPLHIDEMLAQTIYDDLIVKGYVHRGALTPSYYASIDSGEFAVAEELKPYLPSIKRILDSVFDASSIAPENAFSNNIEMKLNEERFRSKDFQDLWSRIKGKSIYQVSFDPTELVTNCIGVLDNTLHVSKVFVEVKEGDLKTSATKKQMLDGKGFQTSTSLTKNVSVVANNAVKFDLTGKIVEKTSLTRKDVVAILTQLNKATFDQFKENPEDFIIKASKIINEQKASTVIKHIQYRKLEEQFEDSIFTEAQVKGQLGVNAMNLHKHLFDYLVYDSEIESKFAEQLDIHQEISVYTKLPKEFYIDTPLGKYNPDWALVYYEDTIKHIFFVAETKGDNSSLELRPIEATKIECAKRHFKAISSGNVKYDVVKDYAALRDIIIR